MELARCFVCTQIYPLDAVYDVPEDVPEEVKTNKRYAGLSAFTIQEVANQIKADYGKVGGDKGGQQLALPYLKLTCAHTQELPCRWPEIR